MASGAAPSGSAQKPKLTPSYYHVLDDKRFRANVYEPEADSFLLLDALDADAPALRADRPLHVAEFGCGSGIAVTHAAMLLALNDSADNGAATSSPRCTVFTAVDINPIALEATAETFRASFGTLGCKAPPLQCVRGDLMTWMHTRARLDVLIFNPPYVPTSLEELVKATTPDLRDDTPWLCAAWSGGPRGRLVVDRVLAVLHMLLAEGGRAYIIALEENDIPDMISMAAACSGGAVTGAVVASRFTGEHLRVVRFVHEGLRRGAESEAAEPAAACA